MGLALPAESASLWNTIHREAVAVADTEPALAAWMHEAVVNQSNLASALARYASRSKPSNHKAARAAGHHRAEQRADHYAG